MHLNRALFRAMFKQHGKKALQYSTVLAFYNLLMIGVYPALSQSKIISDLSVNLPNSVKRIFGFSSGSGLDRFESYVSGQCFGQVWSLVMGIYTISTSEALIAKLIDKGVMAYLLSSPVGRLEVLSTQVAVLVCGLVVMTSLTGLGIWGEMAMFDIPIDIGPYLHLGVLEFTLFLAIGAFSLFFSALFQVEEYAILSVAILTFLCYALDVFSGLDDRFSWVKNLTIFGWVRPQEVLDGSVPTIQTLALLGLSVLFITLAGYIFKQKDLHV